MKKDDQNVLTWLQNWYYHYCDGDWEHNETIKIYTIDNPGWRMTIDVEGTDCEGKSFQNIEKEISENDWVHCFLRDGKFEGAGRPCNLFEILSIFKEWAMACVANKQYNNEN